MKKLIFGLITVPLFVTSVSTSNTQVINSVETEAIGDQVKVETNITTKVNGNQTEVKVNQPGKIEVRVENNQVEIKKGPSVFPTIITSGSPTITEIEDTDNFREIEEREKALSNLENNIDKKIYNFLKSFWSNVIGLFQKKS